MENHILKKKEETRGRNFLEVANKLGLKDFQVFIRTDPLNSQTGIMIFTDDYKHGTDFDIL